MLAVWVWRHGQEGSSSCPVLGSPPCCRTPGDIPPLYAAHLHPPARLPLRCSDLLLLPLQHRPRQPPGQFRLHPAVCLQVRPKEQPHVSSLYPGAHPQRGTLCRCLSTTSGPIPPSLRGAPLVPFSGSTGRVQVLVCRLGTQGLGLLVSSGSRWLQSVRTPVCQQG